MSKSWIFVIAAFIIAGIIIGVIFIYSSTGSDNTLSNPSDQSQIINPSDQTITTMPTPSSSALPNMILDPNIDYTAVLNTSAGKISIHLNSLETPLTVNNFVFLAKKSFYNNTIFHRVIQGFMIQGGDPSGNGTGGPGYTFSDEPFSGEYTRGILAMANAGPNTNGSQFFIIQKDTNLPKNYVIFGKVINGLDVVDTIASATVSANLSGEYSQPVNPVKIISIDFLEKKLPKPASPSATPKPT